MSDWAGTGILLFPESNTAFTAFCNAISSNIDLDEMVDDQIIAGHQTPLLTYFLNNADQSANKSCILIESTEEKNGIDGEGYTAEFKEKVSFVYTVVVASRKGDNQDYCESIVSKVREILGTELTSDGYRLMFENIDGSAHFRLDPEMRLEQGFWECALKCTGYTWTNYRSW